MASTLAKVVLPLVAAGSLAGGAVALNAGSDPTGDCALPYDRQAQFGSVPTPAARKAAIAAATVDGVVYDYYTGLPLTGVTPDIDHVFPLKDTWPVTCAMTRVERRSLANDGLNLVPTTPSLNRGKGELGPAEWSPADRGHACRYGTLYERVAAKYDLPVSEEAAAAVQSACAEATS